MEFLAEKALNRIELRIDLKQEKREKRFLSRRIETGNWIDWVVLLMQNEAWIKGEKREKETGKWGEIKGLGAVIFSELYYDFGGKTYFKICG